LVDVDVRRIKLDAVIIVVLDILTPDGLWICTVPFFLSSCK
jgi:hypothetical protein